MPERVRATAAAVVAGDDAAEATRVLRGELGAPHPVPLPVLPEALPGTTPLVRAVVHLAGLPVSLTPHGWRLTGARAGADAATRAARSAHASLVARTADLLRGEAAGPTVVAVAGPATLSARLALPGGEPVAADPGARRDVAQAWAEGAAELASALSGSLPGADPVLAVSEPELEAVLRGSVRSSSGYRTLRAWDRAEVTGAWRDLAARTAVWLPLHPDTGELAEAAAHVVDVPTDPGGWEPVAARIEAGRDVVVRLAPAPSRPVKVSEQARRLVAPWFSLGLAPDQLGRLILRGGADAPGPLERLRRDAARARDLADALELVRLDGPGALDG